MAEAPACPKCGDAHWRFVKCEDADAFAAKERANAAERARLVVRPIYRSDLGRQWRPGHADGSKVYPVYRNPDGPQAA